jgi:ketosteroid isomerase-like protein
VRRGKPAWGTHQGRAAIAKVFAAFFEAFNDATLAVDDLIIDGDRVVQVGTGCSCRLAC